MNTISDARYANFGERFLARLIDVVLVTVIPAICITQILKVEDPQSLFMNGLNGILYLVFWLVYYPIMECTGGTVGKRIVGIQSVSLQWQKPISAGMAYMRSLIQIWPTLLMGIAFYVSFRYRIEMRSTMTFLTVCCILFMITPIAMLWTKERQGYHDLWTGTHVIKKRH